MENQTVAIKELSISEFSKLTNVEKTLYMFHFQAAKLDTHTEGEMTVYIYFCSSFFIEVKINTRSSFYEIIPFKRGFNIPKTTVIAVTGKEELPLPKAA